MSDLPPLIRLLLSLVVPLAPILPLVIPSIRTFARRHWIGWLLGLYAIFMALSFIGDNFEMAEGLTIFGMVMCIILVWDFALNGAITAFWRFSRYILWGMLLIIVATLGITAIAYGFGYSLDSLPYWFWAPARLVLSIAELLPDIKIPFQVLVVFFITSYIILPRRPH